MRLSKLLKDMRKPSKPFAEWAKEQGLIITYKPRKAFWRKRS